MKVYACYNKDLQTRMVSSSGGVFSLLAQKVLEAEGVIYGVTMKDDCYGAEFIRVSDEDGLALLRGSKYMQAKMGDILKKVRVDLQEGKSVLFSGTACQINGLKKLLNKDYENLITLDVICHGAPSPELWRRYALHQEKRFGSKLQNINFRCKEDSWEDFGMKENEVYISKDVDPFMQMFLRDYCLRPSCYNCVAKHNKMSDITIADFWGIDSVAPYMNDGKGTSLVIIRTKKGEEFFARCINEFKIQEVSYEDGIRYNPSDYKSVSRPKERDSFFDDMRKMDFEELTRKYAMPRKVSIKNRIKRFIKKTLLKVMRGGKHSFTMNYGLLYTFENRVRN